MSQPALQFADQDKLGVVASVDTGRMYIKVQDHTLLTHIAVGNLIAVQGSTNQEYLIGITQRITRQVRQDLLHDEEDEEGNVPYGQVEEDAVQVVLVGTYKTVDGSRSNVFKRGADSFPQIERDCYLIAASNLQRLMNLLAKDLPGDKQLKLGHFIIDRSAIAVADGDRFFQRHASILGSTGSGKSWSVALILEKASGLNHPNLIVLDMHGEYKPLTEGPGAFAKWFKIAGPGDLQDPVSNTIFLPHWLLNREEMLSLLVDRSDQNAPNQASRFTTIVRELKEQTLLVAGKDEVKATFTVDSPIPYSVDKLISLLTADDVERVEGAKAGTEKNGDWNGKLTRFIARLEAKAEDRRYGFMFQPPIETMGYDWLAKQALTLLSSDGMGGIKIVDFSEVPSDILPIVVGVFARLLYDIQLWMAPDKRTPLTFVCDEAHLYLPVRDEADAVARRALESFESIAKEGRKYGVSLLIVSQRPSDVSRTILSQCNNFLILRLTNDQDQAVVKRLMPDSMAGLTDILPLLDVGEALLLGDAILLPMRIKLDPPKIQPDSATRNFWSDWGTTAADHLAIQEAVESMRRQTRASLP